LVEQPYWNCAASATLARSTRRVPEQAAPARRTVYCMYDDDIRLDPLLARPYEARSWSLDKSYGLSLFCNLAGIIPSAVRGLKPNRRSRLGQSLAVQLGRPNGSNCHCGLPLR